MPNNRDNPLASSVDGIDNDSHAKQSDPPRADPSAATQTLADIVHLRNISGDTPEDVCEMVGLFVDQTQSQLDELATAITSQDLKAIEGIAHSCKGGSASCGMLVLADSLKKIEVMGRNQKLEGIEAMLQNSRDSFSMTKLFLQENLTAQETAGINW